MRLLVLMLILANLGLLWYLQQHPESERAQPDTDGRLPRVAELELIGESDRERAAPVAPSPDAEEVSAESVPEPLPAKEAGPEPVRYCYTAGWFDLVEDARAARSELLVERPGLDVSVEGVERELSPLHWVIVPPYPSENAALEAFRDFQRRGIDSFLVTEGSRKNAISLGLFESRSAAERVLAQRKSENLNAELALFPRNQLSYALVFEAAYLPESPELGADRAEYGRRFESVEIKRCEGVATAEKSP